MKRAVLLGWLVGACGGGADLPEPLLVHEGACPHSVLVSGTDLFWSDPCAGEIRRGTTTPGDPSSVIATPIFAGPGRIAVDSTRVYYLDGAGLQAVPREGGAPELIWSGAATIVVADDAGQVVAATPSMGVTAIAADGTATVLLAGTEPVADIAVAGDSVYVASFEGIVRIPRAGGANLPIGEVFGEALAIVTDGVEVVWSHSGAEASWLDAAAVDGTDHRSLASGGYFPRALALDETHVYIANWDFNRGAVTRTARDGETHDVLAEGAMVSGIAVSADHFFWTETARGLVLALPKLPK